MTKAGTMRGIAAMICAMVMFITNDMFLKLSLDYLPMGEALTLRSAFGALALLCIVIGTSDRHALLEVARPRVVLRSTLDAFTTFAYVLALGLLPIATTTTIYMAAPLITTALAVPLLGEKVSFNRWCAIFVGFSGAVIVTHPHPDSFVVVALLPLVAAFSGSVRDIATRGISKQVPGSVVALSSALILSLSGTVFASWEAWSAPSLLPALYLIGSGAAFATGSLLMVYAFRSAPVAAISPLRYVLVPCSLLYGYFIFSHVPDLWGAVGTVLVVGAGLYSIQQEARRGRADALRAKELAAIAPSGAPFAAAVTRSPPHS